MRKTFSDWVNMWEEAPANSVGAGGVSLPADAVHDKKKKKRVERRYDGRTKEGRKFVERILARREAKRKAQEKLTAERNQGTVKTKN